MSTRDGSPTAPAGGGLPDLAGRRVTVMGIGTRGGGTGVIRWLAGRGAKVTATDRRTEAELAPALADLDGVPVRLVLGGHDERDFTAAGADMVVRNPAIPRRAPLLALARREGVPVEMEMSLFFRACRAPIVGVTGTKGKTSTSTLTAQLLRNEWDGTVLAGNMGISALAQLDRLTPAAPVVVELSSWQIESLIEHRLSPHVAVITNVSEDHLNTYDGFADYAATKRGLVHAQRPGDFAVLNRDDAEVWAAAGETAGRVVPFGLGGGRGPGAWLEGDELVVRDDHGELGVPRPGGLALSGEHGARNALAAMAVARLLGARDAAIRHGLADFGGVPHRMEPVGSVAGVDYINDTTATAPAAAVAALSALPGRRVHWVGGGFDKGLAVDELGRAVAGRAASAWLLEGTATPRVREAIVAAGGQPRGPYGALLEAMLGAHRAAVPGDVILLSPGCASFGMFRDEFDRGEQFRAAVGRIHAICEGGEPDPFAGQGRAAPEPIAPPACPGPPRPGLAGSSRAGGTVPTTCPSPETDRRLLVTVPAPTDPQATAPGLPPAGSRIHFVGIGGIGMSGLARLLHHWGYRVSGSDSTASDVTEALTAEGIAVSIGHGDVDSARAAALVVMTAAVRGANAEVDTATAAGVPVVKRARLLGMLCDARRGVAVAGSHGKSTTSGMLVVALAELGADPSYAVGAVVARTGTNAAAGTGEEMVVEADEYDYSFLQLNPDVAIVNNVDYDHPDIFPDQATYDRAFADFIARIRPGGTLVISGDDEGAVRVAALAGRDHVRTVTFGLADGCDWRLVRGDSGWLAQAPDGERYGLPLQVPGEHNARNALGALAALVTLGHDPASAAAALGTYTGIGRRFESKGEAGGVTVIDDYAHHPKEVAATIAAARSRFPGRRIVVAFQPHTYSRTHALLGDFATALAPADEVAILDIYAARETDTLGVSSSQLADAIPAATATGDVAATADRLGTSLRPGDVLLTVGAGTVTGLGPLVLDRLRARAAAPGVDTGPSTDVGAAPPARTVRPARGPRAAAETVPGVEGLRIQRDAPMRLYTTWRIGGPADALIRASSPEHLAAAVAWGRGQGMTVTVIGGGSNMLVPDEGIRGLVVLCRTPGERAEGLVAEEDLGDAVRLRVGAQAPLSWTGRYAAEHGWAGLDWGVGLPGTIGGATVNNAGAHGTELKDHLESVTILHADGTVTEEPAAWMEAAYRHTRIKSAPRPRTDIVLAATFVLPKGDREELVRLADEHAQFRRDTQPTGACAGSVFANPPGDYAGRLLEAAGLKGYRIGGAVFSPKHANWIVNTDDATAVDVDALIRHAQGVIRDRHGIELRVEVERFTPDGSPWSG